MSLLEVESPTPSSHQAPHTTLCDSSGNFHQENSSTEEPPAWGILTESLGICPYYMPGVKAAVASQASRRQQHRRHLAHLGLAAASDSLERLVVHARKVRKGSSREGPSTYQDIEPFVTNTDLDACADCGRFLPTRTTLSGTTRVKQGLSEASSHLPTQTIQMEAKTPSSSSECHRMVDLGHQDRMPLRSCSMPFSIPKRNAQLTVVHGSLA